MVQLLCFTASGGALGTTKVVPNKAGGGFRSQADAHSSSLYESHQNVKEYTMGMAAHSRSRHCRCAL
eukprot:8054379-Karenia_brevis.AAC.1